VEEAFAAMLTKLSQFPAEGSFGRRAARFVSATVSFRSG
jgi:hypothetical protein